MSTTGVRLAGETGRPRRGAMSGPLLALCLMLLRTDVQAQPEIVSPEVHPDRTVTFRTQAPQADAVLVKGIEGVEPQPMQKDPMGVWSVTVGPLDPEIYSYVFEIDGADVVDRHNRWLKTWFSLESQVEVPGDPPLLHEQQPVPHGAVTHHIYHSRSVGAQRGVYVYTPPGYDARRTGGYPMLLLLHGFGDDEGAWTEVGRAHFIADNLLQMGRMEEMVIVMPYGHPEPVSERQFSDQYRERNLRAMERDVLQDLFPFISGLYNVSPERTAHAITGLSMGGGHSISIGLGNLDDFAWIGAFSAAAPTENLDTRFTDLLDDVDAANERLRLLWIACGEDDFLLDENEAFVRWLRKTSVDHSYEVTEGAHTWFVWRKYLATFLTTIFRDE